jgi:hypothetical protein
MAALQPLKQIVTERRLIRCNGADSTPSRGEAQWRSYNQKLIQQYTAPQNAKKNYDFSAFRSALCGGHSLKLFTDVAQCL